MIHRVRSLAAPVAAIVSVCAAANAWAAAPPKVDWDRVENIKQAATRLGEIQRRQGATKAFQFIMNCYKTHGLARSYTRYIESCLAQDYIYTQTLASLYARMPPEALKKSGAPSPQALAEAMGKRVAGAFKKYDVPVNEADAFKKLVDKHGFEPFTKIVFPKARPRRSDEPEGKQNPDDKQQKQDQP